MSVFNPTPDHSDSGRRTWRWALAIVVVVIALALSYWVLSRSGPEAPARESGRPPKPEAAVAPAASAPRATAPEASARPAPAPRRRAPKAEAPAAGPEAAATTGPVLRVESDVPGASVFVDRKYLGTTPLTTRDVPAGTHQLNASAEGQDGIVRQIDVGEAGETTIELKFREVKLNESARVVHKHAMGSCEGRLLATVAGLRYESSNKGDAFTLPFADLDVFEVDYLQKNLKVKRRGGKTWNFTDPSGNADNLFVFHREVTKARAKIGTRDEGQGRGTGTERLEVGGSREGERWMRRFRLRGARWD